MVGVILNLSIWFALHTLFRQTTPVRSFGLSFDMPVWSSVDIAALRAGDCGGDRDLPLQPRHAAVLAGSCAAGVALRLAGMI